MKRPGRAPVLVAVVAATALLQSCKEEDALRFEPYTPAAAQEALSLGEPLVIKATADW